MAIEILLLWWKERGQVVWGVGMSTSQYIVTFVTIQCLFVCLDYQIIWLF